MIKPARHILSLQPYNLSKRDYLNKDYIKLDWNESQFPLNKRLREFLINQVNTIDFNLYPKLINENLILKLSVYSGVSRENISVFPGSDVGLENICRTFLSHGDKAISIGPTYDNFRIFVASTGATHEVIYPESIEKYSLKNQLFRIKKAPKLVYFTNPNNPLSYITNKIEIQEILNKFNETLFICDEAYYEFSKNSNIDLLEKNENIVFSRSFSKAMGLAGLRIGYLIANSSILGFIDRIKNFKNLTSISQETASFLLDNLDLLDERIIDNEKSKQVIINYLKEKNINFFAGKTNFILLDTRESPKIKENLISNKFIFREFGSNFLKGYIRITYPKSIYAEKLCHSIGEST